MYVAVGYCQALLLHSIYNDCAYVARVDCVHIIGGSVMKFYNKDGVHTGNKAAENFP